MRGTVRTWDEGDHLVTKWTTVLDPFTSRYILFRMWQYSPFHESPVSYSRRWRIVSLWKLQVVCLAARFQVPRWHGTRRIVSTDQSSKLPKVTNLNTAPVVTPSQPRSIDSNILVLYCTVLYCTLLALISLIRGTHQTPQVFGCTWRASPTVNMTSVGSTIATAA